MAGVTAVMAISPMHELHILKKFICIRRNHKETIPKSSSM